MSVSANCPACGGPVTFNVSTSLVTVCPYCRSVVARGDRGLESLGKVADLVETASPLDVGVKGRFDGVPFALTGRTQFQHPAGGVWDEWYAAFTDGRWGWLAEAQGRFYLTFEKPTPPDLPSYEALQLGQKLDVGDGKLTVAEKNRGRTAGAVGEMPYRVLPGKEVPFADLSGPRGEFGTVDYSDEKPALYVGREVTLDELGIPPKARRRFPGQEPRIQALQLNCPHCGGALTLRAPDQSERVGCPNCGSLLDVREGKLSLLQSLKPPPVQPIIPLGATGQRDGVEWTVIGFMQRYVTIEGTDYFWEEYLLYQPRLGFRWLTRSDDHWTWVAVVPPASVSVSGNIATYAGRWYRLFQKAKAKVAFVVGEFYWKVHAGETVLSRDFVHAPGMLSEEVTKEGGEGEVNWSYGVYLTPDEVEKMFRLTQPLPAPETIGPNQPFPHTAVYRYAAWLCSIAVLLGIVFYFLSPKRQVFEHSYFLKPLPAGQRSQKILVPEPLDLHGHENLKVWLLPSGSPWIYINGSLASVEEAPRPGGPRPKPGSSHPFAFAAVNHRPARVYMSGVPAGKYTLQFELAWQNPQTPVEATLRIEQGVPHPFRLMITLLLLGSVPLATALYQLYFEAKRWQDSTIG
jgi:Zn finger protein HypA/HybF involved in hydrogenase expression